MIMKRLYSFLLITIVAFSLLASDCGCGKSDTGNTTSQLNATDYANKTVTDNTTKADTQKQDNKKSVIDLASIPAYSGRPYLEINGNEPFFDEDDRRNTGAFEIYSNLDAYGRCGTAYANICKDLMPTEERGKIGQIRPSGWHTANYHELVDGNYLYNRCHLIGYQLAGENANEKNLITGTRYLNVEGMLPFENKVDYYVERTNNHVLYRVTPLFEGKNLVASGVLMEAHSVEDNGKGINFCVYCYNVQPGIDIDYATGDSKVSETNPVTNNANPVENVTSDYVLNTNTKKFHKPDCTSVSQMKEKNKKYFSGTREEVISQGYEPCGNCKP